MAKATPTDIDNRVDEFKRVGDDRGSVSSDSESESGERDVTRARSSHRRVCHAASGPGCERIPTLPSHLENLLAVLGATEPSSERGEVKMFSHPSSAAVASQMKIDSENPNSVRRSFVQAINYRKSQGTAAKSHGTAQDHEDRMYNTIL